jgi:putative flavoprotein involved in K+ transport
MSKSQVDTIIVGAGYAGLSASYYLKQLGVEHLVFERGKVGESWRSQRWESFKLNTPNKINSLPGNHYPGNDPGAFYSVSELIPFLENYITTYDLPVFENSTVLSVEKPGGSGVFEVEVSQNGLTNHYTCGQVIVASGNLSEKNTPALSENISSAIMQLHTSEYRNPSQLKEGAVLVVGSGQSGCQIAEDLVAGGRKVYLSTSMVPRAPRRYRGKDIYDWLVDMKFFESRKEDISDPVMLLMKAPQFTGTGDGTKTISLQALAAKGVSILGKLERAEGNALFFQPNAVKHIKFADGFSKNVKDMIDGYIMKNQISATLPEVDVEDLPDMDASCASLSTWLNVEENNINTIIWTTGFGTNLDYIKLPVLDDQKNPKGKEGVSDFGGLYFIGWPWQRTRKSALLYGIKDDAEFISQKVFQYSKQS